MEIEKIANFIKIYRKEKGLTQQQLAELVGVTEKAVSKWENGWTSPDIDNLVILSDLYNISIDELLKNEQDVKKTAENLKDSTEHDEKELFGMVPEEMGILIAVMCLSAIPCLGFIGIILLLSYCVLKKYKIGSLYKVILIIFVLISVYNSVKYMQVEFLDMGKATVEKVAFIDRLYFRNF